MKLGIAPFSPLTVVATVLIVITSSTTASAQYGMGFGDMFFMNFRNVPSPTDFLNQRAIQASARGMQGPRQNRAYTGGANSFHSRSRDPGFVSSGNVARRGTSSSRRQPSRDSAKTAVSQTTPKAETANAANSGEYQVFPLQTFFDDALRVLWPKLSPTNGELGDKRGQTDRASLAVLVEVKQQQIASLGSVTEARQRLLDYGRPALLELRNSSTEAVAEEFHRFLYALYQSLSNSAAPTP